METRLEATCSRLLRDIPPIFTPPSGPVATEPRPAQDPMLRARHVVQDGYYPEAAVPVATLARIDDIVEQPRLQPRSPARHGQPRDLEPFNFGDGGSTNGGLPVRALPAPNSSMVNNPDRRVVAAVEHAQRADADDHQFRVDTQTAQPREYERGARVQTQGQYVPVEVQRSPGRGISSGFESAPSASSASYVPPAALYHPQEEPPRERYNREFTAVLQEQNPERLLDLCTHTTPEVAALLDQIPIACILNQLSELLSKNQPSLGLVLDWLRKSTSAVDTEAEDCLGYMLQVLTELSSKMGDLTRVLVHADDLGRALDLKTVVNSKIRRINKKLQR
jgi:hypothetical protein